MSVEIVNALGDKVFETDLSVSLVHWEPSTCAAAYCTGSGEPVTCGLSAGLTKHPADAAQAVPNSEAEPLPEATLGGVADYTVARDAEK